MIFKWRSSGRPIVTRDGVLAWGWQKRKEGDDYFNYKLNMFGFVFYLSFHVALLVDSFAVPSSVLISKRGVKE